MLINYIKVALRNMLRQKLYSTITISGLAIGMTCFFIISAYMRFEESYDNFHTNSKYIYRVDKIVQNEDMCFQRAFTGVYLGPLLQQDFPSVKSAVRIKTPFLRIIGISGKIFKEKRFLFADNNFFDVFSFRLLIGEKTRALAEPNSVVITSSSAKKYFGSEDPVGKIILDENKTPLTVTGIVEDPPSNSTIKFDFIAPFSLVKSSAGSEPVNIDWDAPVWTYIQLNEKSSPAELEKQFPDFVKKNISKGGMNPVDFKLVALKDIYYTRADGAPMGDWGLKPVTYILYCISLLVLLIACLNFVNLLSIRSVTRAKEIGVRKVQGAGRFQLMLQFLGESIIASLLALIISIPLSELLLPFFISLISSAFPTMGILPERNISFSILNFQFMGFMTLVSLAVGVLSGLYPAFVLSRMKAAYVIKGELRVGKSSTLFRKVLIIFQFALALIFINCTVFLLKQIDSWKNRNLGFNKNNIIAVTLYSPNAVSKYESLKALLNRYPKIESVTSSDILPGCFDARRVMLNAGSQKDLSVVSYTVDYDFIKTMGLKIKGGRDFKEEYDDAGQYSFIINESAAKLLGFQNAVDQPVEIYLKQNNKVEASFSGHLIGIVNNFKYRMFASLKDPLIIRINNKASQYLFIKTGSSDTPQTVEYIRAVWNTMNIDQPFEYSYLSDEIDAGYSTFDSTASLTRIASVFEIMIAGMGLFALASFVIERKTKEIGIRKVLGASLKSIIYRLSKSFLLLVIIASAIASPFSYIVISKLLQNVENHVDINLLTFILTSGSTIIFSILVVGFKAYKAAAADPVNSMRCE